jgi:hypothetical protein
MWSREERCHHTVDMGSGKAEIRSESEWTHSLFSGQYKLLEFTMTRSG